MHVDLSRRALLASASDAPATAVAGPAPISVFLHRAASTVDISPLPRAFHYGRQWVKPFLYPPLLTPSGLVLSHGDINGVDFWRELKPSVIRTKGDPKIQRDGLTADFDLLPPTPTAATRTLTQQWTIAHRPLGLRIDVRFTDHAGAGKPRHFGDTGDGGFGIRLCDEFAGTKALWGKPARRVDYSAPIEDQSAGVAIDDHPANLRYPSAWPARLYGLNAANPFANSSFSGKDAPSGEYEIPAGQKRTLAHRVLIHDGMITSQALDSEASR